MSNDTPCALLRNNSRFSQPFLPAAPYSDSIRRKWACARNMMFFVVSCAARVPCKRPGYIMSLASHVSLPFFIPRRVFVGSYLPTQRMAFVASETLLSPIFLLETSIHHCTTVVSPHKYSTRMIPKKLAPLPVARSARLSV